MAGPIQNELQPTRSREDLASQDFLYGWASALDPNAGNPYRILIHTILASAKEPLSVPEAVNHMATLVSGDPDIVVDRNTTTRYRPYVVQSLVPRGQFTPRQSMDSVRHPGRKPIIYEPTPKARACLPALGAVGMWQASHDIPLDVLVGAPSMHDRALDQQNPKHKYSNHVTGRLRILQTAVTKPDMYIHDAMEYTGRASAHKDLTYLADTGVLERAETNYRTRYTLNETVQEPVEELLLALCSLQDASYREQAVRAAAAIASQPEAATALMRKLPEWEARPRISIGRTARPEHLSRPEAPAWITEKTAAYTEDSVERGRLTKQLRELYEDGVIGYDEDPTSDERILAFTKPVIEHFDAAERRAIAERYGIQGLLYEFIAPRNKFHSWLKLRPGTDLDAYVDAALIGPMKYVLRQQQTDAALQKIRQSPDAELIPTATRSELAKDFLSKGDLKTILDAVSNNPARMLIYMVLGEDVSPEGLSMPQLIDRCNALQGDDPSHVYTSQSALVYKNFIRKWLVPAGYVKYIEGSGVGRGRSPSRYQMTAAGEAALHIVGALASWQTYHDEPISTFTGEASTAGPDDQVGDKPYQHYASSRLRILQTALTQPTVDVSDTLPYMRRTRSNTGFSGLEKDGVLDCYSFARPMKYALRFEKSQAAADLLLALRSLRDEDYRIAARTAVGKILSSPALVRSLLRPRSKRAPASDAEAG